jgi:hypothetical protein
LWETAVGELRRLLLLLVFRPAWQIFLPNVSHYFRLYLEQLALLAPVHADITQLKLLLM